jgi:hypothetical protein
VIGNSVTSIGDTAFAGCSGLTSVAIPDSVTTIGFTAFLGCTGLKNVAIPDSVTAIGAAAFKVCTSLTAIDVDPANPAFSSSEGVLFNKSRTALLAFPEGKAGAYAVPDSVTAIGDYTFQGCTRLTSITIGSGVTSIGIRAFSDCASLTSVEISSSVNSIGHEAFCGCTGLTRVCFAGNAPLLGDQVLRDCPAVLVYYRAGTAGWGPTFAGRPTALWIDPPRYSEWLPSTGLLIQYPNASAEADDPDQDGMSNYAEMLAGTDPTDRASLLILERVPRPADLTEADRTPIAAGQHALYFRSVPGKRYGVQWADAVDGPWSTTAVVIPATTQKRLVFDKPATHAFYRVILAQ